MGKWNNSIRKAKRLGVVEPTEMDHARLAAYIDGEGCISTSTAYSEAEGWKSETVYINVSVHNTDPRLIDWCVERWGGRVWRTTQKNKNWSSAYGWRVSCQQARKILEACLPFFIIKREQAEVAIALMNTMGRWGSRGMPQEVRELRWELRRQLSDLKGKNSRIKNTAPRILDYESRQNYDGNSKEKQVN